jgi:glycosyltransferase 2 family protein
MRFCLYILISLVTALLFLWLAFRSTDLYLFREHLLAMNPVWLFPFTGAFFLSHWFRSKRWGLLISSKPPAQTLFAGLMLGYLVNTLVPRAGELARPAYVGKKTGLSTGRLLGTVVLERVVDVVCLAALLVYVFLTVASGSGLPEHFYGGSVTAKTVFVVLFFAGLLAALAWWLYRYMSIYVEKGTLSLFLKKILGMAMLFWEGVTSIRNLRHRSLFLFYTLAIWVSYMAVFWFPFFILDLHEAYSPGLSDALVVMVFSAAGFAIPTPGGTGSFHFLVQQSLIIICGFAAEPALTYALITHAAITAAVFIVGGAALLFDRIIISRQTII